MSTFTKPCVACGKPVNVEDPLAFFQYLGYAQRSRTGGGIHHFKHKQETGRVMHYECDGRLTRTGVPGQLDVFEAPGEEAP